MDRRLAKMAWVNIGTLLSFLWEGYTLGLEMHSQLSHGTQGIWQNLYAILLPRVLSIAWEVLSLHLNAIP